MAIEKDLLDRLLANYKKPEDLIGETGLLKQLTKALLEPVGCGEPANRIGRDIDESRLKVNQGQTTFVRISNEPVLFANVVCPPD